MRERFDFSSISKIILDNRKTESFTHEGYYYTLFSYAFTQQEYKIFEPEQANLNKIINGERNVPKYIISLYDTAENHSQLEQGVIEILEDIADTDYVREQLYDLLWNDPTISQNKKEKLSKLSSSISKFITECLIFGMLRNFIARTKKNEGAKRKKNFLISDYLLNYHFPSVNKVFLGRENDLIEVHRLLSDTSPLFLEGIGGIGKSELAKQYGKRYKDEYEHVLFIRYQDNLRKTIIELEFIDDTLHMSDDELFRSHYRFFKQLSADTLVILDNFDTVAEKEELFHEFISMPFQLLITTRSHIEEASCYHVCEIDDTEALLQLFQTYAPQSQYNTNLALEIIDEVYRHTLTVEMTAKTLTASDITMEELLLALRKEGIALSNPNKVKVVKDDRSKKERLHKHIQTLFMLQDLSLRSQYTLMNMALVPDSGIPKNLFHEWLQTNDFNVVNELVDYGWIQQDSENNRISLHPFLHEVIADSTKPTITKCAVFITGIFEVCFLIGIDVPYYRDVINTIESMFQYIIIDDYRSAYLLLDRTLAYLGKYEEFDKTDRVLKIMDDLIPDNENYKVERANYELYKGAVENARGNRLQGIEHFKKGIKTLQPMHPEYAIILSNLYNNLGLCYMPVLDTDMMIACWSTCMKFIKEYNLPDNHDIFLQKINMATAYILINELGKAEEILSELMERGEQLSNFGTTMSYVYTAMYAIRLRQSLYQEAKQYLEKAKDSISSHLGAARIEVKFMDLLIMGMDTGILLNKKFYKTPLFLFLENTIEQNALSRMLCTRNLASS